jgi:hypothetical protein
MAAFSSAQADLRARGATRTRVGRGTRAYTARRTPAVASWTHCTAARLRSTRLAPALAPAQPAIRQPCPTSGTWKPFCDPRRAGLLPSPSGLQPHPLPPLLRARARTAPPPPRAPPPRARPPPRAAPPPAPPPASHAARAPVHTDDMQARTHTLVTRTRPQARTHAHVPHALVWPRPAPPAPDTPAPPPPPATPPLLDTSIARAPDRRIQDSLGVAPVPHLLRRLLLLPHRHLEVRALVCQL